MENISNTYIMYMPYISTDTQADKHTESKNLQYFLSQRRRV